MTLTLDLEALWEGCCFIFTTNKRNPVLNSKLDSLFSFDGIYTQYLLYLNCSHGANFRNQRGFYWLPHYHGLKIGDHVRNQVLKT